MQSKTQALRDLHIPRSTFYYTPLMDARDAPIKEAIEATLAVHKGYGYERVALHLKRNKKQIQRVMQKYNLHPSQTRKKQAYKRSKGGYVAKNYLVSLLPLYRHYVWVTDFTYLWWRGRFIYVATVMDLYTREILGVSVGLAHTAAFVSEALLQALQHGRPTIVHSDQGSEYRSNLWHQILLDHHVIPSMSEKGSPWQNGYQESFYANFKVDLGDVSRFETFGELLSGIYQTIHYYNHARIHLALKCSPKQFVQKLANEKMPR